MRILRKSPHVMIILQLYGHRLKPSMFLIVFVCLCQGSSESDMVIVNPHEMKPYMRCVSRLSWVVYVDVFP